MSSGRMYRDGATVPRYLKFNRVRVSTPWRGLSGFACAIDHRCFRREVDENRRGTGGSDGFCDRSHSALTRKMGAESQNDQNNQGELLAGFLLPGPCAGDGRHGLRARAERCARHASLGMKVLERCRLCPAAEPDSYFGNFGRSAQDCRSEPIVCGYCCACRSSRRRSGSRRNGPPASRPEISITASRTRSRIVIGIGWSGPHQNSIPRIGVSVPL